MIDHTLLRPEAAEPEVVALCAQARALGVAAVCVAPTYVELAAAEVAGSPAVASVCGFPSGAHLAEVKAREAALAVSGGAAEVDMVLNLGAIKSGRFDAVEREVRAVVTAVDGALVKAIIESAALTDREIVGACRAAVSAGAGFVKTSTGFHPAGGATVPAVSLMRATVGPDIGVKASGGIRTAAAALALVAAGADRLGCSASAEILAGVTDAVASPQEGA
jgi:deoxyribose-phosphate aldolase